MLLLSADQVLEKISCPSIAISAHSLSSDDSIKNKNLFLFYKGSPEGFVKEYSASYLFKADVDFVFFNGVHLFDEVLKAFVLFEADCSSDAIVLINNSVPGDSFITNRSSDPVHRSLSKYPGFWTGDIWKIIPILKKYRPDLKMTVVDSNPVGTVIITNLDRENTILSKNYQNIISEYFENSLESFGVEKFYGMFDLCSSHDIKAKADIFDGGRRPDFTEKPVTRGLKYASPLSIIDGMELPSDDIAVAYQGDSKIQVVSRPAPFFHDDPDNVGLFSVIDEATINQVSPFTIRLTDARLVGYRCYITKEGRFFTDEAYLDKSEEQKFLSKISLQDQFSNEETGLRWNDETSDYSLFAMDRQSIEIKENVISLCSLEPTNYGAFLFRLLPKLIGTEFHGTNTKIFAPVFGQSMISLFEFCGIERDRIIHHDPSKIYEFKSVLIPSVRNPHALLDGETKEFYRKLSKRFKKGPGKRKLFVSRLGWSGSHAATSRVMVNEKELANALVKEGFEIILPHEMNISDQISAFASADIVVGASGSAMFNAVFCRPGTKLVDIESEPHWIFAHANLFGSCDLHYGIIEACAENSDWSVPHKNFRVNVAAVISRVRQLVAK